MLISRPRQPEVPGPFGGNDPPPLIEIAASKPWWASRLLWMLVVGLGSVGVVCALYGASPTHQAPDRLALGALVAGALFALVLPLPTRVRGLLIEPGTIEVHRSRGEPVRFRDDEVLLLAQRRAVSFDGRSLLPARALRLASARADFKVAFDVNDAPLVFGLLAERCTGAIVMNADGAIHVPDVLRGADAAEALALSLPLVHNEYQRQRRGSLIAAAFSGIVGIGVSIGVVEAFSSGARNAGKGAMLAIVSIAVCIAMLLNAWRITRRSAVAVQTIHRSLAEQPEKQAKAA
jgi:hypothetical protein